LRKKPWSNANCNKLLCIARGWSTDAARVTKRLVRSFRNIVKIYLTIRHISMCDATGLTRRSSLLTG